MKFSKIAAAALFTASAILPVAAHADSWEIARVEMVNNTFVFTDTGCDDPDNAELDGWTCTEIQLTRRGNEKPAWTLAGSDTIREEAIWARAIARKTNGVAIEPVVVATESTIYMVEDFGDEGGLTTLHTTTRRVTKKILDWGNEQGGIAVALEYGDAGFFGGLLLISPEGDKIKVTEITPRGEGEVRVGDMIHADGIITIRRRCTPENKPEQCHPTLFDLQKGTWVEETAPVPVK